MNNKQKDISVWVTWPNNDTTQKPGISNKTTEVDEVEADIGMIQWNLGAAAHHDKLKIEKIKFYTDAAKKNEANTSTWFTAGANHGGNMTWYVRVLENAPLHDGLTLYYDLYFDDGAYKNIEWDPTLKLKPRG